jgi:hypothetical protein
VKIHSSSHEPAVILSIPLLLHQQSDVQIYIGSGSLEKKLATLQQITHKSESSLW